MKTRATVATLAGLCVAGLTLTGCSGNSDNSQESGQTYRIGISQIVAHPSLDQAAKGFKDAIAEAGLKATYDEQNAQGESSNAATIAGSFASDSKIDLVLAIATPTAQAAVSAIGDKPVLFTAVTDPVAAELVSSLDGSGTNVTGTSDQNPEAKPLELIRQVVPGAKTVGVLYSSAEVNSGVQVDALKKEAKALGMSIKESAVTNSSEVATGAQALKGVDAIYVPTDNTVVSALETVVDFAETTKTPMFAGEAESVERGAIATRGIDYYQLGKRTGEMAVQILKDGKDPGEIPTLVATDTEIIVNPTEAEKQGVKLDEQFLKDATVVGT